ncbi:unnamed protein product [Bursaphelenchus okinawaensis]|uniref:DUF7515 domain-containing protein n=1 Tax=Bursaphelenchus okinawaensis TaxID=465554 RepID=A0A811JSP3_9BILA|nr:unnamed protein product [Bursaphelenchus okinawaensis]CAG9081164.1 unnamed protein product [Bursaphelenchus okinawaensis]
MQSREDLENLIVSTVASTPEGVQIYKFEKNFKDDWGIDLKQHYEKFGASNILDLVDELGDKLILKNGLVFPVRNEKINDVIDLIEESKEINEEERIRKRNMNMDRRRFPSKPKFRDQRRPIFMKSDGIHGLRDSSIFQNFGNSVNMIPLTQKVNFGGSKDFDDFGGSKENRPFAQTYAAKSSPFADFCSNLPSTSPEAKSSGPQKSGPAFSLSSKKPLDAVGFIKSEISGAFQNSKTSEFGKSVSSIWSNLPSDDLDSVAGFGNSPKSDSKKFQDNPFGRYPSVKPTDSEFGVPTNKGDTSFWSASISESASVSDESTLRCESTLGSDDVSKAAPKVLYTKNISISAGYKRSIAGYLSSNSRLFKPPITKPVKTPVPVEEPDWDKVMACVDIVHKRNGVRISILEKELEQIYGSPISNALIKKVFGVNVHYLYKALTLMKGSVFKYDPPRDFIELKYPYNEVQIRIHASKAATSVKEVVKDITTDSDVLEESASTTNDDASTSDTTTIQETEEAPLEEEDRKTSDFGDSTLVKDCDDLGKTLVPDNVNMFGHSMATSETFNKYRNSKLSEFGSDGDQTCSDSLNQAIEADLPDDFDFKSSIDGTAFYINKVIVQILNVIMKNGGLVKMELFEKSTYRDLEGNVRLLSFQQINYVFGIRSNSLRETFEKLPQFFKIKGDCVGIDSFVSMFFEEGSVVEFNQNNVMTDVVTLDNLRIERDCIQNAHLMPPKA